MDLAKIETLMREVMRQEIETRLKPLAEHVAGVEMALFAIAASAPDRAGLLRQVKGAVAALRPEFRASGSTRVLFKLAAYLGADERGEGGAN